MSPRAVVDEVLQETPVLHAGVSLGEATRAVVQSNLPALPVVDAQERYAGIFGEREFIEALFPGYVRTLGYAGFVPKSIEQVLEKRRQQMDDPVGDHMNDEHVDVPADVADIQIAETFIHHRILVIPVTDDRRVVGIITRHAFFEVLAERFLVG
jgi:CBS domain-containing protein